MAGKKRTKKESKKADQQAPGTPGAPTLPTDLEQEISKAAAAAEAAMQAPKKQQTQSKKATSNKKKVSIPVTDAAKQAVPEADVNPTAAAKKAKTSAAGNSQQDAPDSDHDEAQNDVPDESGLASSKLEPLKTDIDVPEPHEPAKSQEPDTEPDTGEAPRPAIGRLSVPAASATADSVQEPDTEKDGAIPVDGPPALQPPDDANDSENQSRPVMTYENAAKAATAEQPETTPQPNVNIEDGQIDDAVEDIVRAESDALLAAQDSSATDLRKDQAKHKEKKTRPWRKLLVWTTILLVLAAAIAAAAVPASRYAVLNALGVRVSASVSVVDDTTRQPLRNVSVQIGEATAETDEAGEATLSNLPLGPQSLSIERIAFATIEREVTIGWGSNPLGTFRLIASGVQYTFVLRDHLSAQPIEGAEVSSGRLSTLSDEEGKAVLTTEHTDAEEIQITVSAEGYRTEDMSIMIETDEEVLVTMVPDRKAVYVARGDDGRYNVYGMYVDGTGRTVLLAGTGTEDGRMTMAASPDAARAAVVSTRENIRAEDGTLLQSLTLVRTNNGNAQTLERALDIRLVDWIGTTLVYRMTMPGVAADSSQRQRLMSYDYAQDERVQLAAANEFTSIASAQGAIYYSTAVADGEQGALMRIGPDGTNERVVLAHAVRHAYRTDYGTMTLQTRNGWYELALGPDTAQEIGGTPASTSNRIYVTNSSGTRSLWVDGEALMVYDIPGDKNTRLDTQSGLDYPVYWLTNNAAAYRVADADYAMSVSGETPHRVASVIPTTGIIQTY